MARFTPLPLNEASWLTYPFAAIPTGVRMWGPLTRTRAASGLRGLATRQRWLWALRAPLVLVLGLVGSPVLVLDAVIVTVQAIRAGGGRDSAYLRRHAEQLVTGVETSVRGWFRVAGG